MWVKWTLYYYALIQLFLNCTLCLKCNTEDESSVASPGYITQTLKNIQMIRELHLPDLTYQILSCLWYKTIHYKTMDGEIIFHQLQVYFILLTYIRLLHPHQQIVIVVLKTRGHPLQVTLNILLIISVSRGEWLFVVDSWPAAYWNDTNIHMCSELKISENRLSVDNPEGVVFKNRQNVLVLFMTN
jgi:hypothetical protein